MKRFFLKLVLIISLIITLTSCNYHHSVVGKGAQGKEQISEWNHYLFGIIPIGLANTNKMANGATNYTIQTYTSLGNGAVSFLTLGIYTPTTTIVTK